MTWEKSPQAASFIIQSNYEPIEILESAET